MIDRFSKEGARQLLRTQLGRIRAVKHPSLADNQDPRLKSLQQWQQARLASTYGDIRSTLRFGPACEFFINDLYGPQDFSQRDANVERIFPIMVRILPGPVLGTVAQAVELDALSHELDRAVAQALVPGEELSSSSVYARAYCAGTSMAARRHQLALLLTLGRELDRLVRKPLLWELLRLCRWPARIAGLGELQSFLERGFDAFKKLNGAGDFLRHIAQREKQFMRQMHALTPDARPPESSGQ